MLNTEKRFTPDDYLPLVQRGKVAHILPCGNCGVSFMPDIVLNCPGTFWSSWRLECSRCGGMSPSYPPHGVVAGTELNPNPLTGAIDNWNYMQEYCEK